jgi:hypothetical protein
MVIISLLLLCLVAVAFIMRGAPEPPRLESKQAADAQPEQSPEILHPWSSGAPEETDDFAEPNGIYGPGTSEPDKTD